MGIGGDERVRDYVSGGCRRARQMAGLLPSCLRAFSALPDFLSSVQHFLNVPSVAVQRTFPGRACFAPPGRGRCRIRFRPRNLLRIYLVPFCVGYSQSRLEPNVIEPRLLFDPLVDCVFFSIARGRGTPMSSRYHLLQTDDTYLWAAAGVSITVILVVLAL